MSRLELTGDRVTAMLGLLPTIEDDETIYSFYSTVHFLSGRRSSESTSKYLLGISHGAKQHDLPSVIPRGLYLHDGSAQSVLECLRAHTVAAMYLPFLSEADQLDAAARFADGLPHARRRFDGRSRSISAPHDLKWCAVCLVEDQTRLGRAYWHVAHQIPSCLTCPKHHEVLHSRKPRLKTWALPSQFQSSETTFSIADRHHVARRTLSAVTDYICRVKSVDTTLLRLATIQVLRQMSVLHDGRSVQVSRLVDWFSSTGVSAVLSQIEGWGSRLSTGNWIATQLWRRKQDHPIRWVVLWAALEWPSVKHAIVALNGALLDASFDESGQMGIFPLSQAPTQTPLRVREAIESCGSYQEVQLRLGLSRATLLRWLEHDPKLRIQWKMRKLANELDVSIQKLMSFARAFPHTSPKDLEQALPTHFRYLRSKAPEKLRLITSALPSRLPVQLPLDLRTS